MFGGNPGNDTSTKRQQNMRLDDFWRLKVSGCGFMMLLLSNVYAYTAGESEQGTATAALPVHRQEAEVGMA